MFDVQRSMFGTSYTHRSSSRVRAPLLMKSDQGSAGTRKILLRFKYYPGSITSGVTNRPEASHDKAMSAYRLGDLQLRIMQVLWDQRGATVAGVHEALRRQAPRDRQLAYTTVATMLRKMEDRGLVTHDADGRKFVYRPAIAADEVTRSMAGDLLDRLFEGSLADMVHHLLTEREVSQEELSRLELLIAERKTQRRGGRHGR